METASLNQLRKSLATLKEKEITEMCLRLARYKKENKELLSYLLYFSGNEQDYIKSVQEEIDLQLAGLIRTNSYLTMKGIRKALRITNKYIKYSGNRQTEAELLLYFCSKLRSTGIRLSNENPASKLFDRQILKIQKVIASLHEDLQFDYGEDLKKLTNNSI